MCIRDSRGGGTGTTADGREVQGDLISSRGHVSVAASYAFTRWLQVGLELPINVFQDRPSTNPVAIAGLADISGAGLRAIRVAPKLGLLRQSKHGIGLAFIPAVSLPSQTSSDAYLGGEHVSFAPELAIGRSFGRVRLAANLGWRSRKLSRVADLQVDDEVFARVGVGSRLIEGARPLDREDHVARVAVDHARRVAGRKQAALNLPAWGKQIENTRGFLLRRQGRIEDEERAYLAAVRLAEEEVALLPVRQARGVWTAPVSRVEAGVDSMRIFLAHTLVAEGRLDDAYELLTLTTRSDSLLG